MRHVGSSTTVHSNVANMVQQDYGGERTSMRAFSLNDSVFADYSFCHLSLNLDFAAAPGAGQHG